jgi:hypothetical protein
MTSHQDRHGVTCAVPDCTQDPHGPDCVYATATPPPGEPGWKPGFTAIPDHRSLDELREARNAESAALIRREAAARGFSYHRTTDDGWQPPLEATVARHAGPRRTVAAARVSAAKLREPGGAAQVLAALLAEVEDDELPEPHRAAIDATSREADT